MVDRGRKKGDTKERRKSKVSLSLFRLLQYVQELVLVWSNCNVRCQEGSGGEEGSGRQRGGHVKVVKDKGQKHEIQPSF